LCVSCEKRSCETVKGNKNGLWEVKGSYSPRPTKFFLLRQTYAISVALWSFHANSEIYAIGVELQDQFFKVVSFLLSMLMYYYYMQ
jgi:hypothetical protein